MCIPKPACVYPLYQVHTYDKLFYHMYTYINNTGILSKRHLINDSKQLKLKYNSSKSASGSKTNGIDFVKLHVSAVMFLLRLILLFLVTF